MMMDWTRLLGLCVVNGRIGSGDFTCVSSKGSSVVDYCLVFKDDLGVISDFNMVSMSDFVGRYVIPEGSKEKEVRNVGGGSA